MKIYRVLSVVLFFCLISNNDIITAQNVSELQSLESILNPDGTVNLESGISGSFNPAGFQMIYGENGEPIFSPAGAAGGGGGGVTIQSLGNESWDDQFFINGIRGTVYAIAVSNTGDLYVGGAFTGINDDLTIQNFARWDGSSWSALGGVDGEVDVITVDDTNVYIGGYFTEAGGSSANCIALWNGSSWSALGSGVNNAVRSIAIDGSNVYVGGDFSTAGGNSATFIALWNGSNWSTLGSGVDNTVYAIAISGSNVYAGGYFTTAGGNSANYIAQWNGSSWSTLGSGVNSTVHAIAISGSNVYVGGDFTTAGGNAANKIALWNGSNWSTLGSGVDDDIRTITISGSDVYVGGYFTAAGGNSANYIARWNGSSWSALGSGVTGEVYSIASSGSNVYLGGGFQWAGGVAANKLAGWNGSSWFTIGQSSNANGINNTVYSIAISGGDIYAGGFFTAVGGNSANNIAKWDGSSWSALGSGVDGTVHAIAISGSDVYVGGEFTTAGGNPANYIAQWNGSSWSALGSGVDGGVSDIAISGSDVYVVGGFTTAGGNSANHVAQWNGSSWSALGSGISGDREIVIAVAVNGSHVYVGGSRFGTAGGVPVNNIAHWNGSSWSALGSGISGQVNTIAISDSIVYAGGDFTTAGGNPANYIAKWDGSSWTALGNNALDWALNARINSIAISGGHLYAGGWFASAEGNTVNHIARWDGSSWMALGSGVDGGEVLTIAFCNRDVYIGGSFELAGGKASDHIGRFSILEPTSQPTNISFSNITDSSITVSFAEAADPPDGYIAVRRAGASPTFIPVDGTSYTIGQTVGDGIVAFVDSLTTFNESGLNSYTTYYYNIFSYHGSGILTNYLPTAPLEGSQSTMAAEPTAQPTDLNFSNITSASLTVSFTAAAGSPDGYIAVRRTGASPTFTPLDGISYSSDDIVGDGTVAYTGSSTTFDETNFNPETTYYYDIFSYNGSGALINYLSTSPLESSQPTYAMEPSAQPTNIEFSNITDNSFTVSFTAASGSPEGYIAIRRSGAYSTFIPSDGTGYALDQNVGDGTVAYIGGSTTFNATGLSAGVIYFYDIFSYNGSGQSINYLTTSPLEGNRSTIIAEPEFQPTNLMFSDIATSSLTISFNAATGSPDGYLALRRTGAAPTGQPTDGISFSVGETIGDGIVAYAGNSIAFTDTGLSQNEHFYAIFAFNGSDGNINYLNNNPLTGSQSTLILEPTEQPTNLTFTNVTQNSFTVSFYEAEGSPAGYIAIRKTGSSPTFLPSDSTTYTLGHTVGDGTVVFIGSELSFNQTGLAAETEYYYDIFSYNGGGSFINYLSLSPLEGSVSTLAAQPTTQATDLTFSDITDNSFTVAFSAASDNPDGYLVTRSTGQSPDFTPVDKVTYSSGQTAGNGIIAYIGNGTSFSQTGMTEGTIYYYNVFSFNGSGALINYLTTSPLKGSQSTIASEPAAQPTDLVFSNLSDTSFTVSFSAAVGSPDGYIAIRKSGSTPNFNPADGTTYTIGQTAGNGYVAYAGSNTTFNESGLTPSTEYFYTVFSFNGSGTIINYLTELPLEGSQLLDVSPPDIGNITSDPDPAVLNSAITITVSITDASPISNAFLYYKKGDDNIFQNSIAMSAQGDVYSGIIPAGAVGESGTVFRVFAEDIYQNDNSVDGICKITIPANTFSTSTIAGNPYQSGFPKGEWRMISIPLDLDDKEVSSVLSEFGQPGNTSWKLYEGSDTDVSTSAEFIPGKAFWLKHLLGEAKKQITLGSGKTVGLENSQIPLSPGWNQIGSLFTFAIDWLQNTDASENPDIKGPIKWNGSQYIGIGQTDGDSASFTELLPWDGYYVYNAANSNQILVINPVGSTPVGKLAKTSALKDYFPHLIKSGWKINVTADVGEFKDSYNYIGVIEDASDGEDRYDLPELPVIGSYVSLYFDHEGKDGLTRPYTIDYRAPCEEGVIWTMYCRTNINNKGNRLQWKIDNFPDNYIMAILDISHNRVVEMKENIYSFTNEYESYPIRMMVFAGTEEFVEVKLAEEKRKLPQKFNLSQNYPNPFNPATTIGFDIVRLSKVSLEIYNILGQRITTLINHRIYDTGSHEIIWDGTNDSGMAVSSGLYFYLIRTENFAKSKKMILIR